MSSFQGQQLHASGASRDAAILSGVSASGRNDRMRSPATLFVALLACALLACTLAAAQGPEHYPSRAIRYVVASAPGGIADITPRVLAPRLAEALRQPVVVKNRPAGGIVAGGEAVATAPPDGYTLL